MPYVTHKYYFIEKKSIELNNHKNEENYSEKKYVKNIDMRYFNFFDTQISLNEKLSKAQ